MQIFENFKLAHIAAAARAKLMSSLIPKLKLTGGMSFYVKP